MEVDVYGSGYGSDSGGDSGVEDNALNKAARNQVLRFSNFLITVSTNVQPQTNMEDQALVKWLVDRTKEIFEDWSVLNGNCLKPAGSNNNDEERFPNDHRIISVKCKVAVEQNEERQRGQMHAHWLVEVAHTYADRSDVRNGMQGVHVNVYALRNYLNSKIPLMEIDEDRLPQKIYVNSRLLTKENDNQSKWLTLQYLNKTVDRTGTNLIEQRQNASEDDRITARGLINDGQDIELTPTSSDDPPLAESPSPPLAPRMSRVTASPPQMIRTTVAPAAPTFTRTTMAAPQFVNVSNLGIKRGSKGAKRRY